MLSNKRGHAKEDFLGFQASQPSIRILESEANKKGDLFGRLMEDLFLALGYDRIRLNIHKPGREIDLQGMHRTERRRVIAECKATDDPVGGSDINKFIGSLDAERKKQPEIDAEGYLVSLRGFTETAIEQEAEVGNDRVNLLTGYDVVRLLISGHVLVSEQKAMELAGRCAASLGRDHSVEEGCELLAYEAGWLWLIYFSRNKERTHFALVHADGQLIAHEIAKKVTNLDKALGGELYRLAYLSPPRDERVSESDISRARKFYEEYLSRECGEVQLEGLPADEEAGSKRLKLENIYVPLFVREVAEAEEGVDEAPAGKARGRSLLNSSSQEPAGEQGPKQEKRVPLGAVLSKKSRLAVLGLPGSGKSTLLKRLAVAYASPNRRPLIKDHLPKRSWLPLMIRCRQLDRLAKRPIVEILDDIAIRAEMPHDLQEPFKTLIRRALRDGDVLILVDGLDEISDEGNRLSFAIQFRTFLSTYPKVGTVVSSREAGFRVIGGALTTHCANYQLAEFSDDDIARLTLAWHKVVVGDSLKVRRDAQNLATTICRNSRVRELAKNPLLLTTLLLVQRWVGQLPTKRSVLYSKAIEVLLMTWNVEAYQPLDQDEALPQLEFLAVSMMKEGAQGISLRKLEQVLINARQQMPEVLGFARMSVGNFIKRVESRSSLLMVSGHEIEEGTLYPLYEFRHLTFQEYLAARAMVYGHYPQRHETDDLRSLLRPHLNDPGWKEVIPLAAVLAGRDCQALIQDLIEGCKTWASPEQPDESIRDDENDPPPCRLLATCLSDEAQLHPDLLVKALRCVAEKCRTDELLGRLRTSKFGDLFGQIVRSVFKEGKNLLGLGNYLTFLVREEVHYKFRSTLQEFTTRKILELLRQPESVTAATGCLAAMEVAYAMARKGGLPGGRRSSISRVANMGPKESRELKLWVTEILPMLESADECLKFSACWALVWLADATSWSPQERPQVLSDLVRARRSFEGKEWEYMPAWGIACLPLIPRDAYPKKDDEPELPGFIEKMVSARGPYQRAASYTLAYYRRGPWNDQELAERLESETGPGAFVSECKSRLLAALAQR